MRRGNLQESWRSVVPTPKIWDSEAQVALINQWRSAHAKIVSEPEDRPWKLREFMAAYFYVRRAEQGYCDKHHYSSRF